MRYALLSDVHGNLEAFQAVLRVLKEEGPDCYICIGDIVGYGANPRECIKLVKDLGCLTIAGNHDWAAVDLTSIDYFNPYAKEAVLWTRSQLSQEDRDFLKGFELVREPDGFTIAHATLKAPEEWNYIFSTSDARQNFQLLSNCLLFVGHSHVPIVFEENGGCRHYFRREVNLQEGRKYIPDDCWISIKSPSPRFLTACPPASGKVANASNRRAPSGDHDKGLKRRDPTDPIISEKSTASLGCMSSDSSSLTETSFIPPRP